MWRIGSYITQGVYTVSGPFHPFGGAVDIVVVEQPDGTFKSSPWYLRFGKFQGVLKAKERIVYVNVNGVDADFHMHLDHKGEAFFLREVDAEDGDSLIYPSSGDDPDDSRSRDNNSNMQSLKSKSCNFDSDSSSRGSQILGLVFGRRSVGEGGGGGDVNMERVDSMERAEIVSDLLDLKWSTDSAHRPPRYKDTQKNMKSSSEVDHVDSGLNQLLEVNGEAYSNSDFERGQEKTVIRIDVAHEVEGDPNGKEDAYEPDLPVECVQIIEAGMEKQLSGEEVAAGVSTVGTTVLLTEGTETVKATKIADIELPVAEVSEFHSRAQRADRSDSYVSLYDVPDSGELSTPPESQTVNTGVGHCSTEKVESNNVTKPSGNSSLDDQTVDESNIKSQDVSTMLPSPLKSLGDSLYIKATMRSSSASLEEEHFLFSDLDEGKISEQFVGSVSPEYVDKEDHLCYKNGTEKEDQFNGAIFNSHSYLENSTTENQKNDIEKLKIMSSPMDIPRSEAAGEEVGHIGSLPSISSHRDNLGQHNVSYPLSQSLDSKSNSLPWTYTGKDDLRCPKLDESKENQLSPEKPREKGSSGDPSLNSSPPDGNWRIWPFSLSRSGSTNDVLHTPDDAKDTTFDQSSENTMSTNAYKNDLNPNPRKKKVTEKAPTSEQVASLNLKEGSNIVTFTFSTAMLGRQQVDARIYLWKWNNRVVISDVDGTITKSDVLGQFMPLVGIDWSQTGVAHLFSAIKENGYQLLFLSARSISQAYLTRQFLFNLKQDGKVLPDGPVVISPDGIFPSLYREVIRRVPHEFKIACLEEIKALFPSDCNPFYAGFGNRDTDEISYLKVGIPMGKIFIINPRGEIVVNRRLDTKSYTSLHALVNGMFPPMNSSEKEDFNSWNFWKLPLPVIDI